MTEHSSAYDAIVHLNSIFYSTSPASYFWQRLNSLLVVAAGDGEYGPLLRAGIKVGSEGFTVDEDELIRTDMSADALRGHVVSESVIILAHVSESLLRTFLGHDGRPASPWIRVSSLRSPSEFWTALKEKIMQRSPAELRTAVADCMLGSPVYQPSTGWSEDQWNENIERLSNWLKFFGNHLQEDSASYNSAKHGFGIRASETYIGFQSEQAETGFEHSGPSIDVLEPTKWQDDTRTWSLTTCWQNPVSMWLYSATAFKMLEALWQVGRARYMGHPDCDIFVPHHLPRDVLRSFPPPGPRQFRRSVVTERRNMPHEDGNG